MSDVILSALITTIGLIVVATISAVGVVLAAHGRREVAEATEATRVEVAKVAEVASTTGEAQLSASTLVLEEVAAVHVLVNSAHTKAIDALVWMLNKMESEGVRLTASERSMLREAAGHLTEPRIELAEQSTEDS